MPTVNDLIATENDLKRAEAEIERLRAELKDTQWQLLRAQRALGYSEPERAAEQLENKESQS